MNVFFQKPTAGSVVKLIVGFTLAIVVFANCGPAGLQSENPEAPTQWGAHDVSILYPLPQSQERLAALVPLGGADSTLLSTHLNLVQFESLLTHTGLAFESEWGQELSQMENWKLLALRLDPCSEIPGQGGVCAPQARLSFQPLISEDLLRGSGQLNALDQNIHLTLNFREEDFQEILDFWWEKRKQFPGVPGSTPLGVHPILENPEHARAFSIALGELLERLLETGRTQFVGAMLTLNEAAWVFAIAQVDASGDLEFLNIPKVEGESTRQSYFGTPQQTGHNVNAVAPRPQGPLSAELVAQSGIGQGFEKAGERAQTTAVEAAFLLLNPKTAEVADADCVSCHTVSQSLHRIASRFPESLEQAVQANPTARYSLPAELESRMTLQNASETKGDAYVVRMFGYFEDQLVVSQRTINETAEVLRKLSN